MSQLKYWNGTAWVDAVIGAQGTTGTQGIQGATGTGTQGVQGIQGLTGTGIQGTQGVLGPQGLTGTQGASGSAQINYWNKTVAGGETSLSGTDDSGTTMSYVVGQELFYLNGVLLERGVDYVATTGTSITDLSALSAADIATLWSPKSFTIADTYTQAQINTLVANITVADIMDMY